PGRAGRRLPPGRPLPARRLRARRPVLAPAGQLARRAKDRTAAAFVLDGPDGPAGWAVATLEFRPEPAPFQTRVEIADWGCLPGADAALFALFAGYASMNGMVAWSGPDPDPGALYALRDRFARLTDRWHWMLRLVD